MVTEWKLVGVRLKVNQRGLLLGVVAFSTLICLIPVVPVVPVVSSPVRM